jgi:DNA-directed RNA polymerase specialized sigma24 family protein
MEPTLRGRVRAGDPDAFGVLFDDHASAVYNHAFRLTSDWSLAEEAVSLTFLKAWRLRGRLEPVGGSLRPWLLGITVNVVRNMNRAARRHQAAMSRLPAAPPVPDFADDLADRMDDAVQLRQVKTRSARSGRASGRCSRSASGQGSTTRRRRGPLACQLAPSAPGFLVPVASCAHSRPMMT